MSEELSLKDIKEIRRKIQTAKRSRERGLSVSEYELFGKYKEKLNEVRVICGSPSEVSQKATKLFQEGYQVEGMSDLESSEGEVCMTLSGRKGGLDEREFGAVLDNIGLNAMKERIEGM